MPDSPAGGNVEHMADSWSELSSPFDIVEPARWRAPIIFNSPHSGTTYPHEFLITTRIDMATLRRSEDSFMDELIAGLAPKGFAVMRVNFPRSYVDVNREPYELDPRMFHGRLPSFANTRSMRVAGGLGTIPRVVGDGQDIYSDRLSVEDALRRIETLYKPYHRALRRLLGGVHQKFGAAVLIDCHSMPSVGVSREEPRRPDIVIGDRYGTSCSPLLPDVIEQTHDAARLLRRPQQTLCRRLHHRALRQSRQRIACDPDRTQSRDLHGRAFARAKRTISRASPKIWRSWLMPAREIPLDTLGPFQAAAE